jgi:hypothetical protein
MEANPKGAFRQEKEERLSTLEHRVLLVALVHA